MVLVAMTAPRVLVVEDEAPVRVLLRRILEPLGYEVEEAATIAESERALRGGLFDAAVIDYRLPDGTALDLIPQLAGREPRTPCLVLTGHGSIELAVRAIQEGADHFLTKPVELPALATMVARIVEVGRNERHLRLRDSQRRQGPDPFEGMGAAMQELCEQARRVAAADATALIQGETGAGKGIVARWIHERSPRAQQPFVDINCATLTRDLLESELFGHRKGAFTGAVQDKVGLLEVAHHGTVFLDEIGGVHLEVQPKLLKALEERRFRRVGDATDRSVDIRLIAATNENLTAAVEQGRFRSDLFYRINTVPLRVPPLRDRTEDIPTLAARLLNQLAAELGRLSVRLAPETVAVLRTYPWPGNVRELRNVLERAVLLTSSDVLLPENLHFPMGGPDVNTTSHESPEDLTLDQVERRHIERVLARSGGRVAEAARRLGVPRSSLYDKLKRHGITLSESRTAG